MRKHTLEARRARLEPLVSDADAILQELCEGQESGFPEETGRTSNGQSFLDRDLRSTAA